MTCKHYTYCIMSCNTNLIIQWYCTQDLKDIFHERNIQIILSLPLRWRHIGRDSVSNHQLHDCLLNRLFRRRSKKTSKLRVTGPFFHRGPVNAPHKWPVKRNMFPFDDVIMLKRYVMMWKYILWHDVHDIAWHDIALHHMTCTWVVAVRETE